jgi:hypothetical protein
MKRPWFRSRTVADHILEATPPRQTDEAASSRGFWWVLLVWAVVVVAAGCWRGCG